METISVKCQFEKMMDVDLIVEHPRNANKHPDKQIQMLSKILKYQGWRAPLVISKRSGFLVNGHGRLMAAKKAGQKEVPVNFQDFENEAQEIAHLYADNKIAELAEHDDAIMLEGIKDIGMEDFDFDLLGIEDFNIQTVPTEVKNTSAELDVGSFDNFDHQCPKCGFEWNDNGSDNS